MKAFLKKSKQGITLVESVIAVVLLGFAATGILSMLIASGTKIFNIGGESAAYAEATQKMDLVISAISNGSTDYFDTNTGDLIIDDLMAVFGDEMDGVTLEKNVCKFDNALEVSSSNIRGWYLTLKYKGATVEAFASHTEGAFDHT